MRAAALAAAALLLAAGCGRAASGAGQRTARVLYAGSLAALMEHRIGPGFQAATGDRFSGVAGGSTALAQEITAKLRPADVFISAAPGVNALLSGPAHGRREQWYATFATAPLLVAYNRHSRFAAALRTRPWYAVAAEPGFRLGGTDPRLDPKGVLTTRALAALAARTHTPDLASRVQVFPEEELLGRLESGQLDAGFFYANEAAEAQLPTVRLGLTAGATYTVSVLRTAPDAAAGTAFVAYLLGPRGRALLARGGLVVDAHPTVAGTASAVPAPVRSAAGLR